MRSLTLPGAEPGLPERVRRAIQEQGDATERLIGWVQLAVVATFAALYALAPKTAVGLEFQPVPLAVAGYSLFTLLRLVLAYRMSLPSGFLLASIVIDMTLLFGLIWSFHLQYGQPPSFYLKAPTMLYVFIFIALRALRFEARFVVMTGLVASLGWLVLVGYVVWIDPENDMITRDYVHYMTSNSVLLGAEFDKIASILTVTAILTVALLRGRRLLVRAVSEGLAARELSRFFDPEIAQRIRDSERAIAAGSGEAREATILTLDMRGFTSYAERQPPAQVMALLADYQGRMVPAIQAHGGSIDKFLGDGILATFGAAVASETYAADALKALDAALAEAEAWRQDCLRQGRDCPPVNAAAATGRVVFGAVGDETRLEYTVIGEAVNLAAKLEKGNKELGVQGLCDAATYSRALDQGYQPPRPHRRFDGAEISGLGQSIDLVVLAD
jgi:adenylate cyclase